MLPVHFDDLPLAVVRDGENVVREQVVADLAVAFFEGTLLLANETPPASRLCDSQSAAIDRALAQQTKYGY